MGKIGSRYIIKKYERRSGDDINSPAFFYLSPENITSIAEIIDALPAKLVQEMDERTGKALEYSFKPQDVTRLKDKLKPMRRITKLEKLGI